jgi:two-component system, LytTR family, sensor kinase
MKTAWYSRKWKVVLHAAAWILLFSLPYLLRPAVNNDHPPGPAKPNHNYYFSLVMNLSWIALFYFNALFLIPRLVYKKKYWLYGLMLVITFAWLITQTWILFQLFMNPADYNIRIHLLFSFFVFLFILATSTAFRMMQDKIRDDKLAKERETENLKTELSLLRSQVSPHFMFNVLNNMVALARKHSDQLEPSLIKLSSLMRYMLYEADEEKVSLEKEIEYLQSYIDLQQQRFGKNIKLNTNFTILDDQYQIEPMLLIPFVENAFKHGTGMIEDAQIDIDLKAEKSILHFSVRNKYGNNGEIKDKTSGIGLTNVTRRLNLLHAGGHTLLITNKDEWFTVSLQLNLN